MLRLSMGNICFLANESLIGQFTQPDNDPIHIHYPAPVLARDGVAHTLQHHIVGILWVPSVILLSAHSRLLGQLLAYVPTREPIFLGQSYDKPVVHPAPR